MDRLPDDAETLAWQSLHRAARAALERVEAALQAAGLPPLAWYDVLWEVERAGRSMRPRELEARLLLSQPNVSRLLDRMVRAGLLTREACLEDGRGWTMAPTDEGRAVRARMWSIYGPAIAATVGGLAPGEARALAELLGRLGG